MGVRPPSDGGGEPDAIEFGIAALAPEVEDADIEFPAEASEIVRVMGDPAIPVDAHGNSIPLSRAIEATDRREFGSERELLNALHPVLEARRESVSNGLFASLRGLLPY